MRRLLITATATVAILAMLVAPAPALANNDPHRTYVDNTPYDLDTTFCPFPVHVDSPFQAEYERTSTLPDGSTFLKVTGPLFVEVTNTLTGKAVTVNASSSGTMTISPDGYTVTYDSQGRSLWMAPNFTSFGLPSGLVALAGSFTGTFVWAPDGTFTATAITGHYRVLTDVCAALS